MPIYAPSLPPRSNLGEAQAPVLVLARFDLKRILRQKLGKFFGFAFLMILIVQLTLLYVRYLLNSNPALAEFQRASKAFLDTGPTFHANLLRASGWLPTLLWFQVALVGGGLIARDTLYRTRPLMYAHPLTPKGYLLAKALLAVGLPFLVMLPFTLLPWGLSLAVAGLQGPVWPAAPLLLMPAAFFIALIMGAVALGASSLASTPKGAFGWVLGIVFGGTALGNLLAQLLGQPIWGTLSPALTADNWALMLCGVWGKPSFRQVLELVLATAGHVGLWGYLAYRRIRSTEVAA